MNYEDRVLRENFGGEIERKQTQIEDALHTIVAYQKIVPDTNEHLDRIIDLIENIKQASKPYVDKMLEETKDKKK